MSRCYDGQSAPTSVPVYLSDVSPPHREHPRTDCLITDGRGRGHGHGQWHRLSDERRAKNKCHIFRFPLYILFFFLFFFTFVKFASPIFSLFTTTYIFILFLRRPPILPTTPRAPWPVGILLVRVRVRTVGVGVGVELQQHHQQSAPTTAPSAASAAAAAIRHGSVLLVPHPPLAAAICSPAPVGIE